jgi:hypothetical protein
VSAPRSRGSSRAVTVPAADGYHFGDDHEWGEKEQNSLIDLLKTARRKFDERAATDSGSRTRRN